EPPLRRAGNAGAARRHGRGAPPAGEGGKGAPLGAARAHPGIRAARRPGVASNKEFAMRKAFVLALGLLAATLAGAQEWPSRPVRLVVPHSPGGGTARLARIVHSRTRQ